MRIESKSLRQGSCLFLLVTICCLSSRAARADAVVVVKAMTASTIAELEIEPGTIHVDLEIGLNDLSAFRNLLPDAVYEKIGFEPEPLPERLQRFFGEDLILRADDGPPIFGRVETMQGRPRVRRDQITGDPLPSTEEQTEVVYFVSLSYPLTGRPRTLILQPPRGAEGYPTASIGFMVYHRGLPVMDFRYLGAQERLLLDWDDPWYTRFENRNLRRQFDAPLSAFLYIEPREVRKEIVLRPKDLQEWVELGLEGREVIPVAEQEELKRKVATFLSEHSDVTIDGKPVKGELDRIHFIYRNLRTSGVIDPPRDLETISALLGVIYVYRTDGLPQEVTLEWELFDERVTRVPAVATDEAGGLPSFLTADDNVLTWQNFLQNPTIPTMIAIDAPRSPLRARSILGALCCIAGAIVLLRIRKQKTVWSPVLACALILLAGWAGFRAIRAAALPEDEAATVLTGLLKNVYRAFDYRDESRIYDTLEQSVAGDLLTKIYLETKRSLELENQGGARARVKEVDMVDSIAEELRGRRGFVSESTWNVSGSVGHWGHVHQRRNQYRTRVVVEDVGGAWKITDLEVLQEERL